MRTYRSGHSRESESADYGTEVAHGIHLLELKDGKVIRETDYFAPPFEAPEWRAKWVERF
jgi:hypothetical protein